MKLLQRHFEREFESLRNSLTEPQKYLTKLAAELMADEKYTKYGSIFELLENTDAAMQERVETGYELVENFSGRIAGNIRIGWLRKDVKAVYEEAGFRCCSDNDISDPYMPLVFENDEEEYTVALGLVQNHILVTVFRLRK